MIAQLIFSGFHTLIKLDDDYASNTKINIFASRQDTLDPVKREHHCVAAPLTGMTLTCLHMQIFSMLGLRDQLGSVTTSALCY